MILNIFLKIILRKDTHLSQKLLCFHTNFRIICSSSINAIGILIGFTLDLYIASGNMVILTILILPIWEHSISFQFFVLS